MHLHLRMTAPHELACYTIRDMVLTDAVFVSHLVNLQQGKMGVGWMGRSFVSPKCSLPNLKTGPRGIFITTTVVMLMLLLSLLKLTIKLSHLYFKRLITSLF